MAAIIAELEVNFTSGYLGQHRVCWRVQGSGDPYDCTTTVSCPVGACQALISMSLNPTSCDGPITIEGYVQPVCQDVLSTDGRLTFTQLFTPDPVCQRNVISCDSVGVDSITVDVAGTGYPSAPTVTITGDGAGATATANITVNAVNGTSEVLPGGVGYTDGVYVDHPITGGTGTGLTADITVVGGAITVFDANSILEGGDGGTGYTVSDVLQPDPAGPIGTPGTPWTFTVASVSNGLLLDITVTAPGAGYTTPPVVTVANTGSTPTTATAVLAPCGDWLAVGTDCDVNTVDLVDMELGDSFATCIVGALSAAPAGYGVLEIGCCIPGDTTIDSCFDYHVENTDVVDHDVHYTACDGIDTTVNVVAGTTLSVCAILGGVRGPAELVISTTGATCP